VDKKPSTMSKGLVIFGILGFILLLGGCNGCSSYNGMVEKNEAVTAQWQQVENVYQRRMDLIPNLVQTVQGYADFEKSTLTDVVNARANATKVTIDASKLDEESLKKFEQAQGTLSSTLSRLMVVAEQYPDLKANQGFSDLRTQLEGTENRITQERKKFNETAQDFNVFIKRFPKNIWAGMFGFDERAYFHMQQGADTVPKVNFNFKDEKK
jgi:LemA protein